MKKALYSITSYAPNYYHVHIMAEEAGRLVYTGESRFCYTWAEAVAYAVYMDCISIKKI